MTYFIGLTLLIGIFALPVPFVSKTAGWWVVKLWARFILLGLRAFCGVKTLILGQENIPSGAAIIGSNHQSTWDMVALLLYLPRPTFIVKKELFKIPVFGWWIKAVGSIGIDRGKKREAMSFIMDQAAGHFADARQIVIFPEGTRVAPTDNKAFSMGVARLYATHTLPGIPFSHNSGYSWSRKGFKITVGTITGTFCAPIDPGLSKTAFLTALEASVRDSMVHPDSLPDTASALAQ